MDVDVNLRRQRGRHVDKHTKPVVVAFSCLWPDPALSSNARGHWRKRATATKAARTEAGWAAKRSHINRIKGAAGYDVECAFSPPDNRRRDKQNFPHLVKAHIDGIADALGCDDHCFNVTYVYCEPGLGVVGFEVSPTTTGARTVELRGSVT